ncbi:hypothetical protein B879_01434 [Cecembia lonarensis LW9]|uniref:Uncharacterized protein n=1 Tax=Cecembia lonarensis (strain CCUG 58316 / KCTC 22772 / LW9) TaxID=1225176 RepID=K1M0Z6_CECL9|nr:hypothetical protein B879_01434 [Cecembia lonarensis LW9]
MKEFLRSFSYREILSSLFAAFMFVSLVFLFRNLSIVDSKYVVISLVILGPILLKHRFYLLEHKRRNRILGRLIHNLITAIFIFLLIGISLNLVNKFYEIGSYLNLIILSVFIVFLAEFALSLINLILSKVFKLSLW